MMRKLAFLGILLNHNFRVGWVLSRLPPNYEGGRSLCHTVGSRVGKIHFLILLGAGGKIKGHFLILLGGRSLFHISLGGQSLSHIVGWNVT
jgi:hypothetical protein